MKLLRIDPCQPQASLLEQAATLLAKGALAVLPTDTVYGLGVAVAGSAAADERRLEALYRLKRRDANKAIPLLVNTSDALVEFALDVPAFACRLADRYWPGPLTLVVRASDRIPAPYQASDGSVALRMPNSVVTLALIAALGSPLAVTSANRQGQAPAVTREDLDPQIAKEVDLIVDAGAAPLSQPSTIISCLDTEPRLIRQGAIDLELIHSGIMSDARPTGRPNASGG